MGSRREFNVVNSGPEFDKEDILTFSRFELSTNNLMEGETGSIGLNISFTIDQDLYDKENDCYYEFYYMYSEKMAKIKKQKGHKVDTIHMFSSFTDTNEIRNLADWLHEQADEIDEELKRSEEEEE